ncbi:hypothetical protein HK405_014893 [Cladochytrium tenue]|nr:hypothetical protein HK405_014893 [Cladochytrium tenue]
MPAPRDSDDVNIFDQVRTRRSPTPGDASPPPPAPPPGSSPRRGSEVADSHVLLGPRWHPGAAPAAPASAAGSNLRRETEPADSHVLLGPRWHPGAAATAVAAPSSNAAGGVAPASAASTNRPPTRQNLAAFPGPRAPPRAPPRATPAVRSATALTTTLRPTANGAPPPVGVRRSRSLDRLPATTSAAAAASADTTAPAHVLHTPAGSGATKQPPKSILKRSASAHRLEQDASSAPTAATAAMGPDEYRQQMLMQQRLHRQRLMMLQQQQPYLQHPAGSAHPGAAQRPPFHPPQSAQRPVARDPHFGVPHDLSSSTASGSPPSHHMPDPTAVTAFPVAATAATPGLTSHLPFEHGRAYPPTAPQQNRLRAASPPAAGAAVPRPQPLQAALRLRVSDNDLQRRPADELPLAHSAHSLPDLRVLDPAAATAAAATVVAAPGATGDSRRARALPPPQQSLLSQPAPSVPLATAPTAPAWVRAL